MKPRLKAFIGGKKKKDEKPELMPEYNRAYSRVEAYNICRNLYQKLRRKYGRKAFEEDILECRNILLYMRIE